MSDFFWSTREMKHCARCFFRRLVKVNHCKNAKAYPTHWAEYCQACDLIVRARVHEQQAKKFRARAQKIYEKRLAKTAVKEATG